MYATNHILAGNLGSVIGKLDKVRVGKDLYELIRCRINTPYGFPDHMEKNGVCGWSVETYNVILLNGKPLSVDSYGKHTKLHILVWMARPLGEKKEETLSKLSGDVETDLRVVVSESSGISVTYFREYYYWGTFWPSCRYERHCRTLTTKYEMKRKGNHFSIHELCECRGW